MSTKKIGQKLEQSQHSVQRLILAAGKAPRNAIPGRKIGSGRPSSVSKGDLRVLKRPVLAYPNITAARIKIELPNKFVHMFDRRIQELLKDVLKLLSRSAA